MTGRGWPVLGSSCGEGVALEGKGRDGRGEGGGGDRRGDDVGTRRVGRERLEWRAITGRILFFTQARAVHCVISHRARNYLPPSTAATRPRLRSTNTTLAAATADIIALSQRRRWLLVSFLSYHPLLQPRAMIFSVVSGSSSSALQLPTPILHLQQEQGCLTNTVQSSSLSE